MDNYILNYFSESFSQILNKYYKTNLEEIRIRAYKPIILKFSNEEKVLDYVPTQEEILQILQRLCDNSLYSYQKQITQGFITIKRRS